MIRKKTSAILLLFIAGSFFSFIHSGAAQTQEKYPFSKWDDATKKAANTAKDAAWLSEEEKLIIYYSNLARMNGKLFAETFLAQYVDENELEKDSYVNSLFADLKRIKKLEPLITKQDLSDCARDHAVTSGTKGTIGHQNFTKRFKKYAPKYVFTGENCDYGNSTGLDVVMSLLIDEGVSDKGHRKNILEPKFKHIGVSIQPHKKDDFNAVMCFGD